MCTDLTAFGLYVLLTSIKILPYRPPAWLIRAKYETNRTEPMRVMNKALKIAYLNYISVWISRKSWGVVPPSWVVWNIFLRYYFWPETGNSREDKACNLACSIENEDPENEDPKTEDPLRKRRPSTKTIHWTNTHPVHKTNCIILQVVCYPVVYVSYTRAWCTNSLQVNQELWM